MFYRINKKEKADKLKYVLSGLVFFLMYFDVQSQEVTFAEQIAPIIFNNCTVCHRLDGVAPFPLTNYKEVVKHAKMIQEVTESRFMPPWHPDNSYVEFADQKSLSKEQIALIKKWVNGGMPLGDKSKMPPLPNFKKQSLYGKPDLVLKMAKNIPLPGDNKERFMNVKFPFEIPKDTTICACEFVPGNRKLIHHMDAFIYNFGPNSDIHKGPVTADADLFPDERSKARYFNLYNNNGLPAQKIPYAISDYFPGGTPSKYPNGIGFAFRMAKKGVILMNSIHYGSTSKNDLDSSYFKIYFCKNTPQRVIKVKVMGSPEPIEPPLLIPPNQVKTFTANINISRDISILSIQPHMHLLGKNFLAYAIQPNKDTIRLLRINDWDFNWQRIYKFKRMIRIPAGSTIYAQATYDNTSKNPNNPFEPPRLINHSVRTKDEMLQLWLYFLPYKPGDEYIKLE